MSVLWEDYDGTVELDSYGRGRWSDRTVDLDEAEAPSSGPPEGNALTRLAASFIVE
jgi:hypothetical protein